MSIEPEIKRWTAKRKAELIKQIYRGQIQTGVHPISLVCVVVLKSSVLKALCPLPTWLRF